MIKKVNAPAEFKPQINTVYPPYNNIEFERWFDFNYDGCKTDRHYIDVYWCGYQVNNSYGRNVAAMKNLQEYVDALPNDKKYFTISQYDDGVGVDWKGKDVLEFNMSKTGENMYPLPLIGQPMPYKFKSEKKYLANFIGNITHPIREHAKTLQGLDGYYISFKKHNPYEYCKIISESVFTLCYRGYGINSFRIAEALQYGSIPVIISDTLFEPHYVEINDYGVFITEMELPELKDILNAELGFKYACESNIAMIYTDFFTYESTKNKIINHLETLNKKK